jgi:glycosyltransferase involved in cell wall biosynthesis
MVPPIGLPVAIDLGERAPDPIPRPLRVLVLPPFKWLDYRKGFQSGLGPDPFAQERCLAEQGVIWTILDPHDFPLNPFGRSHNLVRAIDPLRALKILFGKRDFDLIISVFEGGAVPLLTLRHLFMFSVPIAIWDVGLGGNWRLRRMIQDYVIPRASGIMVLGANQVSRIRQVWNPRAPIIHVGHQVDADFYRPADGATDGSVLSVGDDGGRDYATLLEAAASIDAPFVIRSNLAMPAKPPNVSLIARRLSFTDFRELYARAEIVVVPLHESGHAGGISSMLEAFAMGKAVIVSASQGVSSFALHGENCIAVPCGDAAALRDAIDRLIREPLVCQRIGAAARKFVLEQCSMSAFASRFAVTLRRLARQPR